MGYLALYRKYRPLDFDDVYGQEEIVTVIKNAITNNKVSHAYLFSGPRGTGKTTIAKIIARLVNCEHLENGKPCGKCYNCLNFINSNDIVEIDAASNNGVDEIRELRDKINLVPSNSKYKVYIIDEVHMLTNQAFNALLKTLEEPPSHVIFILATTEPHKIPLTISSRCQKFKFSKIDSRTIVSRLKKISELENVVCDDDAYSEIARLSDGCMRDAINLLDQLIAYSNNNITLNDIYSVNGSVSYDEINYLLKNVYDNNKIKIIEFIDNFDKSGKEINKFIEEIIVYLKDVILFKNASVITDILSKNKAIKELSEVYDDILLYSLVDELNKIQSNIKNSSHGSILFMTSILGFANNINRNKTLLQDTINESSTDFNDDKNISREIFLKNSSIDNSTLTVDESIKIDISGRINNTLAMASKDALKLFKSKWNNINDYLIDEKYSSIAGLLKDSNIVASSNEYVIICNELDSIVSRINNSFNKVEELLSLIFDCKVTIVCLSNSYWNEIKQQYISNIKRGNNYYLKDLEEKKEIIKDKTPVDDLIDLVRDSIIEYK